MKHDCNLEPTQEKPNRDQNPAKQVYPEHTRRQLKQLVACSGHMPHKKVTDRRETHGIPQV